MKRLAVALLALLHFCSAPIPVPAEMDVRYMVSLSETGAGLARGMACHAPFTDPDNPLQLSVGTGSLTFTRAHDATHTATFVHPLTGLVTVASNNQLRIEAGGTLIEGERTNSLLNSGNPAAWVAGSVTFSNDNTTAPDGTSAGDLILEADEVQIHRAYQGVTSSAAAYTFSFYAKHHSRQWITATADEGAAVETWYDVQNCAVGVTGTGVTATASTSDGGWCRFTYTRTMGAALQYASVGTATDNGASTTFQGDPTKGVYVWGGQFEAGSFPSSYIPTTTAAMTRNADALSFESAGNLSNTAGTVSARLDTTSDTFTAFMVDGNYYMISESQGGGSYTFGSQYPILSTQTTTFPANVAVRWDGVNVTSAVDGTLGASAAGTFPAVSQAYVGSFAGSLYFPFGHIKNLRIWNRALTDAEIQAITR